MFTIFRLEKYMSLYLAPPMTSVVMKTKSFSRNKEAYYLAPSLVTRVARASLSPFARERGRWDFYSNEIPILPTLLIYDIEV